MGTTKRSCHGLSLIGLDISTTLMTVCTTFRESWGSSMIKYSNFGKVALYWWGKMKVFLLGAGTRGGGEERRSRKSVLVP